MNCVECELYKPKCDRSLRADEPMDLTIDLFLNDSGIELKCNDMDEGTYLTIIKRNNDIVYFFLFHFGVVIA